VSEWSDVSTLLQNNQIMYSESFGHDNRRIEQITAALNEPNEKEASEAKEAKETTQESTLLFTLATVYACRALCLTLVRFTIFAFYGLRFTLVTLYACYAACFTLVACYSLRLLRRALHACYALRL